MYLGHSTGPKELYQLLFGCHGRAVWHEETTPKSNHLPFLSVCPSVLPSFHALLPVLLPALHTHVHACRAELLLLSDEERMEIGNPGTPAYVKKKKCRAM